MVAHVYYPELWPEIAQRLTAISHPFDLLITTTTEQAPLVSPAITASFPHARITVQPNLGMDLLPFLSLIPFLIEQGYTAVCKLHTKKGDCDLAAHWRYAMLDAMVGSDAIFTQTANAFAKHPNMQLAGPATLYQSARRLMLSNEPAIHDLLMQIQGVDLPDVDWGFFAGSMFWIRPQTLKKFADNLVFIRSKITPDYQKDGQLVHAIERLIGLLPALQKGHTGLIHAYTHTHAFQRVAPGMNIGQANIGTLASQHAKLQTDRQRITDSGLFDSEHYLSQNPSLCHQALDLFSHYLLIGRFQNQTPHPDFDATFYTQRHADKLTSGRDPFLHYLTKGAQAGLQLRPTKEQETQEAPNFRYRALNTALIDWAAQATKPRNGKMVSIVIPVFNQIELTLACVDSIYQYTDPTEFELVIVDNGSDAPTRQKLRQLLEQHRNLHLVRQMENLNFALGCNLGFAESSGQNLIFLNNDTHVTANWLKPLLEPLLRSDISAVQPKLLYPDGTIQCMGVVFSNKSILGYPIYAGMKPDTFADRSRSFQAITGACMALRVEDFIKHKGFDPIYINGQEDIDLCLKMNMGKRVCWYSANSTVIHHQSKSIGRHNHIQNNRKIYVNRWHNKTQADDMNHYQADHFETLDWYADRGEAHIAIHKPRKLIYTMGQNASDANSTHGGSVAL